MLQTCSISRKEASEHGQRRDGRHDRPTGGRTPRYWLKETLGLTLTYSLPHSGGRTGVPAQTITVSNKPGPAEPPSSRSPRPRRRIKGRVRANDEEQRLLVLRERALAAMHAAKPSMVNLRCQRRISISPYLALKNKDVETNRQDQLNEQLLHSRAESFVRVVWPSALNSNCSCPTSVCRAHFEKLRAFHLALRHRRKSSEYNLGIHE
jgi:hypothetical protein